MLEEFQFITNSFSHAAQSSLSEKLIVVAVVWFVMGRKVADHFKGLEKGMTDGFSRVTDELLEIRLALTKLETDHANKLSEHTNKLENIEETVAQFDERIEKLEKGVSDGRY